MDYAKFIESKTKQLPNIGIEVEPEAINAMLFPFQRDITRWAIRKGRAAIFADCGLGKTPMQLEWAHQISTRTGGSILILAPLSVADQTVREGEKFGIPITYTRTQPTDPGIYITNYEMSENFNAEFFAGVVLDESSILKSVDGKTKERLIIQFSDTKYRLACTATPAPNDIAEFANHAEFLGLCNREGMLARFFVHDDDGWRLKGHAREPFYRWLASWGMSLSKPSDIGYSDEGYELPPLSIVPQIIQTNYVPAGQMFATKLKGVGDRAAVRHETMAERVNRAKSLIEAEPDKQWIAWCGLNEESTTLAAALGDQAVNVEGAQSAEVKAAGLMQFINGEKRILVSKPTIAGFGMNFQNASRQVFVGLSDSYEAYYQCIRREWRFGQTEPVAVHIVLSDVEEPIYDNVLRKEEEATSAMRALVANAAEYERAEIAHIATRDTYMEKTIETPDYTLMMGDCVERIKDIETDSVGFSVFSPPFASLYTYSPSDRDMGNCDSEEEFFGQFGFLIDELLRVTKPGRIVAVHCQLLAATLNHDGFIGLKDFRGGIIAEFCRRGFDFHGEVCIDKDPQAQAIRTHAKGLLFVQVHKDSSWSRPGLADYICLFRKPGVNAEPVHPDINNDQWIEWARPIWYSIRESDTLNARAARSDADERHIAPLQLETIERCIRLWSNKGDLILSPFMGIGSEGHEAIRLGRRFVGIELKPEYFVQAEKNISGARMQGVLL